MEPFVCLDAVALPIARPNFDTEQILPARYLQKPRSDNFGDYLFRDLRSRPDGSEAEDFVLNVPAYRSARIVVAKENFACGSSREHAVWALHDYGVRAVIAPSVGDIFASNASKNGLLVVLLPADAVAGMLRRIEAQPGLHVVVDLEAQTVSTPDGVSHGFAIDAYQKRCLSEGLDELGHTLTQLDRIREFERRYAY
jgi:3-isopropylmalate/(R)-2-methylmalate dehydratase small subunit